MSEEAYRLARRRILNNAKRRGQRRLDLSGKGLTKLPPEIGSLTDLTELFLANNRLTTLPPEIGRLTSLKSLNLEQNLLDSVPTEIDQLAALERLNLEDNEFQVFPRSVLRLSGLLDLNLADNQIKVIPDEISQLSALTNLDLEDNLIVSVPSTLASLQELDILHLSENQLAELPIDLFRLQNLRFLAVDSNRFVEFPEVIFGLTKLRYLYIAKNKLMVLPKRIGQLTELGSLVLAKNQLRVLPPEIAKLDKLFRLDLSGNLLTDLPKELGHVISLAEAAEREKDSLIRGLNIDRNPLPEPFPALVAGGQPTATKNVLAWLRGELDPASLTIDATSIDSDPAELSETEIEGALEQRPASFRFGLRDGKIDALPEQPVITDVDVAADLHTELLSKVRTLESRLNQTNSDLRARASAARLVSELEKNLPQIRPGILLSRSRSIEADRNAFDTEEARRELFPDAIAMMDDVLLSLQDLMAIFPIIREIEAERVALAIQSDVATLNLITTNINAIKETASHSEIVTRDAADALKENDTEIRDARGIVIQARLVADQLLVTRNFAGGAALFVRQALVKGVKRIGSELGELGGKSWDEVKANLPSGIGTATRALPLVALIGLLASISGPIAGIAGAAAAFRPLSRALKKIVDSAEKIPERENKDSKTRKPKKGK